jgi:tetratricopeptide (TPR) repeat protein
MKALANAAKDKQAQQAAELTDALKVAAIDTLSAVTSATVSTEEDSKLELSLAQASDLSLAAGASTHSPYENRLAARLEPSLRAPNIDSALLEPQHTAFEPNATRTPSALSGDQAAAAKAFVKHPPAATSRSSLIGFALVASLLIGLAVQGFIYMRDLNAADSVQLTPAMPATTAADALVAMPAIAHAAMPATEPETVIADHAPRNNTLAELAEIEADTASAPGINALAMTAPAGREQLSLNASQLVATDASTASPVDLTRPHSLVQLRTKKPLAAVDPALLSAYQAFNRGEYAAAQQQYRQLLQHDVRNVDALLGMAAIAQRQGRDADALGWYQALLEIEPNNIHAQSALLSLQPSADVVASGSRIKNMLVQQPEAASLHAALGHVYAAQNQWTAAQQAYFNASQFAPDNADYAFNLAISLDQLGKSKLALAQYQRSLDLINSSAATSPDRAQLEARMQALQ